MITHQNQPISIKIIDKRSGIDELRKILGTSIRIVSPSNIQAPSLEKYWLLSFIESYGASRNWMVMVVSKNDVPRLIMPLQMKDAGLEFLCDETSDYNDFLFNDTDIDLLQYGLDYWISRGIHQIKLDRIPTDSVTIGFLARISESKGWKISIDPCDTLPIVYAQSDKDIWEWSGVKSNYVRRYRRKLRALNEIAEITYLFIENKSQLSNEFPAIRHLHVARWKALGSESKYSDLRREKFILSICEKALQEKSLFFPLLKINGDLAAYIIGFRGGDTIFDWNTSFSVDYWKWSPGSLLLMNILSNSQLYSYNKYNLMKGNEKYKFIWTKECETNLSVKITIT